MNVYRLCTHCVPEVAQHGFFLLNVTSRCWDHSGHNLIEHGTKSLPFPSAH